MSAITEEHRTKISAMVTQMQERKASNPANPDVYGLLAARVNSCKPGMSIGQRRASLVRAQAEIARLEFPPLWTLAGEHLPLAVMGACPSDEFVAKHHDDRLTQELLQKEGELRASQPVWMQARAYALVSDPTAKDIKGGCPRWGGEDKSQAFWGVGWIENHSIRNYAKVVAVGYEGLRNEINAELAKWKITDPEYPERENFFRAAKEICEAGIILGQRYAEEAEKRMLSAISDEDRERFRLMADACRQVPAKGARTFREATQALWLAHLITCGEDGVNANSLGRIDQILYPYYQQDLDAGRINHAEAVSLMAEFACKLYREYDVQTITLGGQNADGSDATNELSSIILEATKEVGFIRAINIRLHQKSPQAFIDLAADLILSGGGIPYIFNDEAYIPALSERGIKLEDARGYAVIGCVELTIPGKANPHAVSGWFNSLKCLELAMNGGIEPATGEQVGPRTTTLEEAKDFAEFYRSYQQQVQTMAERMVYCCNVNELKQREGGPLPGWSLLTDDCIKRGRDITNGGALYNYHSICFMAAANTADSLTAIRKLVFQEKKLSAKELMTALRADFAEGEDVRQMLLTHVPKYGNDQAEVDKLAGELCGDFIALMDQMRSPLGGRYYVHLFSFLCNIGFGQLTGATPDGRKRGEPIAYSLSAHQGRDIRGVTAMLNSLACIPHNQAAGGSAAIIDLSPGLFKDGKGQKRLAALIKGAFRQGVGQLQFNVVTGEQMRRAKEDPEHYGNLPVRVAGYSQMFKLLSEPLQDHVIARTKHEC